MKWTAILLMTCALGAPMQTVRAAQTDPGPVAGGYRSVDQASPQVLEARAAIQKYFVTLRLGQVQEAFLQVVAGTNTKLVCVVDDGFDTPQPWEFVVWHRLDDRWQLTSARRL